MFLVPDVIWEHYSNEFFYSQKKTQLAFREYLAVHIKNAIGTKPPQRVDPLPSWSWRRRRRSKKVASIWLKITEQVAYG